MGNFYNQAELQDKLKKYLGARHSNRSEVTYQDPVFENKLGLCSGLVAYWLYLSKNNREQDFITQYEHIIDWDKTQFSPKENQRNWEDLDIEKFINHISFLHNDFKLRNNESIKQHSLDSSFTLLTDEAEYSAVATSEFSVTSVLTVKELTQLLEKLPKGKMLRFGNCFHVVGAYIEEGKIKFYNPSSNDGPIKCSDYAELASAIHKGLAEFCKSGEYLALNMQIFDLTGIAKGNYQDLENFAANCLDLGKKKNNSKLQHTNFLRVALRYDDNEHALLNSLFANGYFTAKDNSAIIKALEMCVLDSNRETLTYLLNRGVSIDLRKKGNLSAVGVAITQDNHDMLIYLLSQGANPNALAAENIKPLDLALDKANMPAIAILLAFNPDINADFFTKLSRSYNTRQISDIKNCASEINSIILEGMETDNFSKLLSHSHCENSLKLGKTEEQINLNQKSRELIGTIHEITKRITTSNHTLDNARLKYIASAVDQLHDLTLTKSINPYNLFIAKEAQTAINRIKDFLVKRNLYKKGKRLTFSCVSKDAKHEINYAQMYNTLAKLKPNIQ